MKGNEKHIVHLSDQAVNVLTEVRGLDPEIVFLSPTRKRQSLSNMGMLTLLRHMKLDSQTTVHGFRKSFSSWAYEVAAARSEVVEASLAHREADRVKGVYNKAAYLVDRRQLLDAWADFSTGKTPVSNVVPITVKAA